VKKNDDDDDDDDDEKTNNRKDRIDEGAEERHKKVKDDLPPYGEGVGREMDSWERNTFSLVVAEYL
jgi:hypothetical protein